ncbi:AAA family ATPase [Chryseobacterium indologenes]|uniref:AAA family ATPase n=1 Tax=Chryseobacterium indologenes TaxID=253 RepID=UPI001625792E|nr:AAA family ATPase [Chryseobacterium indologenes]
MITINSIQAIVENKEGKKFGFKYNFNSGLNIISGDNSSGKSTILSCIYYCLGLEQLASYGSSDGLKECLKSSFKYDNINITVSESYAELHLCNDRGDVACIKRSIKSIYGYESNKLTVQINDGLAEEKFIHANGDSDHSDGFYKWLSDFSGIAIPVFEDENGSQKILYLQQIFASSFVEQTKGWSDFFAQVPSFSTKKAKQKIVEYTLGLSGLLEEFELDKLKEDDKQLRGVWNNTVDTFQSLVAFYNFSTANLNSIFSLELSPKKIEKLKLQTKNLDGSFSTIDDSITNIGTQLEIINSKNQIIYDVRNVNNPDLLNQLAEAETKLAHLKDEFKIVQKEKINEDIKINKYKLRLEELDKEIEVLNRLNKISQLESFKIGSVENCPVCNSSLHNFDIELKNVDRVNSIKSLDFYKSERSLYSSYIKSSANLLERFDKTLIYYSEQIQDLQSKLTELNKEVVEDQRIPSRTAIGEEMQLKFELNKLRKISIQFEKFKGDLVQISTQLRAIKSRKDHIMANKKVDEDKIVSFKNSFKQYLSTFGYSGEIMDRIFIAKEDPNKLFPVASVVGMTTSQPIRLVSSASDFIRAQWAFYMSLLVKAKYHLGILVLDEPGQHAMASADLQELLKEASNVKNRQIIVAISKEDKVKDEQEGGNEKEINLITMLTQAGLVEGKDYKLNMIDGNNRKDKCIQPLNS